MENEKKIPTKDQDKSIQNQFTAYLERALYCNRVKYLERENKRSKQMVSLDPDEIENIAVQDDDILEQTFADDEEQLFENLKLFSIIKMIPERSRIILQLHILYEYTFKEIGEILSYPEENIKANYYRTLKYIRERMGGSR